MKEADAVYKIGCAVVRMHGKADMARIKAAAELFMRKREVARQCRERNDPVCMRSGVS